MRKLKNGSWTHQLMIDGKRFSITTDTKAELLYQIAEYKTQRKTKSALTVRDCIDKYIALSEVLSPTTLTAYGKIKRFAFQSIMDLPVDELDTCILQNAINLECKRIGENTKQPLSPKTVKNEWGLVSSALRTVAGRSYMVKLPKVQRKNVELPEPEAVLKAVKDTKVELPCLLAMWCGMRLSEIRGLTFDSIHEDYISIDKVMIDVDGKSILKPLAKTDLSIRKVPMPNYIKGLIKTLYGAKNDLVVPFTSNSIYRRFTTIMKNNGMDISFHDLRHLYASIMLTKLQVPEKIVQKTGGWKTDVVMKSVYSNTFSSSEQDAARVRDDYFESILGSNPVVIQ